MVEVSHGYGRCIEGWRRADSAIKSRASALRNAGWHPNRFTEDVEYLACCADRRAWERLMRETPTFVGPQDG